MSDFEVLDIDLDDAPTEKTQTVKSKTPATTAPASTPVSKTPVSAPAGAKKSIFFRSTIGPERSEKLTVGENTPVRDVKETLANLFGLTPDDFHLSHAGRTMNEDAPIGDYGIDNGDEVLMIPHSTAGVY